MVLFSRSGAALTAILLLFCAQLSRAANLPPAVDLNGPAAGADISVTFTEDAGAVDLCPAAIISDDTSLTELRLNMTPHPEDMAENLKAIPMDGLAVTYNSGNGEMLINGHASASIYQEVLRTLTYNNTSHVPTATTRVIEVTANDGTNLSAARTISVTIIPVNDSPVVDLNGAAAGVNQNVSFYEKGGAVTIAPGATLSDPDGGQLTSMTLTLAPRPNGAYEVLSAATGSGITASYDAASGILSLRGNALLSGYQSVLRTVAYNNTAAHPDATTRTLTVAGQDPGGARGLATAKIRMMVNHAPTGISPAVMNIAENSAAGTVVGTLSTQDPDTTNTFTYAFALPYANGGKFSVTGNTVKLGASINYETTRTIMISVKSTDNGGLSVTKNLTVNVTNVNEPPVDIQLTPVTLNKNSVVNDMMVASLATVDPDANNAFAYTFTSPNSSAGGRFKITGSIVRIADAAKIKADSQVDYPVTIRSTDQGGLGYTKSFTIRISKANAARKWIIYQ